jgi:hypothetical protein
VSSLKRRALYGCCRVAVLQQGMAYTFFLWTLKLREYLILAIIPGVRLA